MLGALACSLPLIGFGSDVEQRGVGGSGCGGGQGRGRLRDQFGRCLVQFGDVVRRGRFEVRRGGGPAYTERHSGEERREIVSAAGSDSAFSSAISCPDSTNCLAVGRGPTRSPEGPTTTAGIIVRITSGTPGSVSHVLGTGLLGSPDEDYLYGVGCTHASECMVAGSDTYLGGILFPVQSGGAGTLQSVDNYIMFGVSCSFEKDYCIATSARR